jgi:hypothetical protein
VLWSANSVSPFGGGSFLTMASKQIGNADARFPGTKHGFGSIQPDHIFNFLAHFFRLGGGQVDLIDDGDDLVVVLERL